MTPLAKEFLDMLDTFYSSKELWDDELKIKMLEQELAISKNPKLKYPPRNTPYFSPSSVNSCPRELYMKLRGAKRDEDGRTAVQGRWTSVGTRVGCEVQDSLQKIEKHWGKKMGSGNAPFIPQRTEEGYPMWEDFAKRLVGVEWKGKTIYFFGTCDGILLHSASKENVGVEVKSKSTTPAQTSHYSMKEEKEDHKMQVVSYHFLYPEFDIKKYLILYWNVAKKGWNMTEEDLEKTPDLRAFEVEITEEIKAQLLDRLWDILDAVENNNPPKLDLSKWTFNNFKTACALDLSEQEVEELKEQVRNIKSSTLPNYIKENYYNAMVQIVETRKQYGI